MTTGGVSLAAPWTWESRPAAATVREAREEISADVQLVRLVDVLGGPDFEVSYPNGDRTAYVTAVYEARIITGSPAYQRPAGSISPALASRSRTRRFTASTP